RRLLLQAGCRCRLDRPGDNEGRLGFAPLQFAVEDFEVGFFYWLDEVQALGGASHADFVGFLHGDAGLAVEGEEDGFGAHGEVDVDDRGVADDYRSVAQRVRADWCDDPGFDAGVNDRAAGAQGIGGGTGRGGDD